jgi:hypothetical protein
VVQRRRGDVDEEEPAVRARRAGSRITAITWKKEIAPKAAAEFVFRARNPMSNQIAWKAHQHFSDGSVADWIGPAGDRRPASVTKLSAAAAESREQSRADAAAGGVMAARVRFLVGDEWRNPRAAPYLGKPAAVPFDALWAQFRAQYS